MHSKNIGTNIRSLAFIGITGLISMNFISLTAHAESWELRTATEEVKGTRDIEAGRLDKGIRVLEANYGTTPYRSKVAVLTNLCLAYTLKQDYKAAMTYCDRAVSRGINTREAHNNRGVLHALVGDYASAIADFERADCRYGCPNSNNLTGGGRTMVARRNLRRAELTLAHQQEREVQVANSATP